MVGLNYSDASIVIIHLFIAILSCINGNSIGLMAGCICTDIKVVVSVVPLILLPLIVFSGFLANSKQFYVWMGWIQYLSPLKYSFEAMSRNEFNGRIYEFGDPIDNLGLHIGLWESIGILTTFAILIRFAAFIFLYMLKSK